MVDGKIRIPGYVSATPSAVVSDDPIEQLETDVFEIQDKLVEHAARLDDEEKAQEDFAAQFLPGRTFMQSQLYKLVYEDVVTPVSATLTYYPGGVTSIPNDATTVGFDVSHDLQHTWYKLSAHTLTAAVLVTLGTYPGSSSGIWVHPVRVYKTAPNRIESFIGIYNTGTAVPIKLKVYRDVGIS